MLLQLDDLHKDFGGLQAVDGFSLELDEGEMLCLIGPNGCGKTTLFNLISGQFAPSAGRIRFRGEDITGRSPYRIARLGISRKFQVPAIYPGLSVWENLQAPLFAEHGRHGLLGLLRRADSGYAGDVLETIGLAGKVHWLAGELAHGEKQWLEIGMLLVSRARLLLLDEPTAGMTQAETRATMQLIAGIQREQGVAVIVIEHDLGFVRGLGCPVAVMLKGSLLCRGAYDEVSVDSRVRTVYLGGRA